MNYKSTRDVKVNVPSAYAISQGLSSDGGLFVPENLPKLSEEKDNVAVRYVVCRKSLRDIQTFPYRLYR